MLASVAPSRKEVALKEADSTLEIRVTKEGAMNKVVAVLAAFLIGLLIAGLIPRPMWFYSWGFVAGLIGGLFAAIWGTDLKVKPIPFD